MDFRPGLMLITSNSVIGASAGQVSCDLQGEAAILNVNAGVYYGLDGVGARIWQLLQQPIRVRDLCDRIVAEFEVERERCEGDVIVLAGELAAAGLITVQNENGAS
jgi:hypothetical protein